MDPRCRIELFGWLRAYQDGRVIARFQTHQTAAVLAYLAFYRHRSHPRDALMEIVWPEDAGNTERHKLRNALASLRRQLEPPGVPAGSVIMGDRSSIQLNPAIVTTDVAEFETALQAAASAKSSLEQGMLLSQAVDLYRGELLPGFFEEWVLPERQRLAEAYLQALRDLVRHLEQARDFPRALDYARRAVSADPLREESHRELMRLLAAAGQPSAALQQYRELERILKEEIGETPTAATRGLVRQLEAGGARSNSDTVPDPILAAPRTDEPVDRDAPQPPPAPIGTVTFLLTDIEGSTAAWERSGEAFRTALTSHHSLLRREFRRHGGYEVREMGDSFVVAFAGATHALACAVAAQQALHDFGFRILDFGLPTGPTLWAEARPRNASLDPEPTPGPDPNPKSKIQNPKLRVRMALHTGDVELDEDGYHDLVLHHASRILMAGHGGQILCSEITAGLLRRNGELRPEIAVPGARLVDLGVYRLRDVATPERLFQVEYPEMTPRAFPPLKAEPAHRGNLPLQFTRFFGRVEEIARLRKALDRQSWAVGGSEPTLTHGPQPTADAPRLITLTGPGGSGKTRLALEVATRLVDPLRGAVWFVPLADLSDPRLIADAVLDALRLPRLPHTTPLEQVVEALSRQPSLLVLDNFEHLVNEGAALVRALLERAPALQCLVTSRQRLNLEGEREFLVLPLPTPGEGDGPERLSLYESVQLFVDRAQAVQPDFQVTNANAAAVAALCHRLEGIPLALELAAARVKLLTPAQMLAHLDHRLDFLESRRRDATARHRTLRAAIDWSYQLLAPDLQRFFARLSVFRGGWSLEAAEAVCSDFGSGAAPSAPEIQNPNAQRAPEIQNPTLDYLTQLQECSLILAEERTGVVRFRMLETLREYAGGRLAATGEADAAGRRHAEFFIALAEEAEPWLQEIDARGWFERLEAEHDNLRSALDWLRRAGEAESALRLAGALPWFWMCRYHWAEGRWQLAQALAMPGASAPTPARARALSAAGTLAHSEGDAAAQRTLYGECLAIWRELEDRREAALALNGLANVERELHSGQAAAALYREALAVWRELGDKRQIAETLCGLGDLASVQGDYEAGRLLYEEGRLLYSTGSRPLHGLAWLAFRQGDYETARAGYQDLLALALERGHQHTEALALNSLGTVSLRAGDQAAARAFYEQSLAVAREADDKGKIVEVLNSLGGMASGTGDYSTARAFFEESLAMARELGSRGYMATLLHNLGHTAMAQAEYDAASRYLKESLSIHHQAGDKAGIADALHGLGKLARRQEDPQAAKRYHHESLRLWHELGDKPAIAGLLQEIAALAAAQERSAAAAERAARLFAAAEALREELGTALPTDQTDHAQQMATVRAALGVTALAAAWAYGRAMTPEEAVAYALDESPPG